MKVQVVEIVDVPLDRAWPVFSDFAGLGEMVPAASFVVDGEGVGAVRTISTGDGAVVQERLESLDPADHAFSYSVINEDAPLPLTGYLATVKLRAVSPGSCEVDWSSEFTPKDVPEDEIRAGMESTYRKIIRFLEKKAGQ